MRIEISAIQIAMTYDAMNLPDRLNYVPVAATATAAAPSMSTTQGDFAVRVTEGQCCSGCCSSRILICRSQACMDLPIEDVRRATSG